MLGDYFEHMGKNPHSLLPRFLGMYSFALGKGASAPKAKNAVHFVVMQSVFAGARELHRQFDLKGSQYSRTTVCPKGKENLCTFKDVDFIRSHTAAPKTFVSLSKEKKEQFLEQVEKDASFLRNHGIMDYSLLLGISTKVPAGEDTSRDAFVSADGKRVYYMGLIDILQTWDNSKKGEKFLKTLKGAAADLLSASPPDPYFKRFVNFMKIITEPPPQSQQLAL
jgi:1-phosphatidylinositol-4-phosphate 5-kinase